MDEDPESNDILRRRKAWFSNFMNWQRLSWFLLIAIAALSSVVASGLLGDYWSRVVALMVAASSSILATIQPQQRARAYREAWIELDSAIKEKAGIDPIYAKALARGEAIIGHHPTIGDHKP